MDNKKAQDRKLEELELPISQVFSQKFLKLLQGMGYRPGLDKIELSTNFETEFTVIRKAHSACYETGLVWFYLVKIPDKYKPKNMKKHGKHEEGCWTESLSITEIFAPKILETLVSLGYDDSLSRLNYSTNYLNFKTTIVSKKTVLRENYFDIIIPDQVRE